MITAVTVVVAVRAVIPSFVTIEIEQSLPAQMKVITVLAMPVPAMKIILTPQPIRITVTVPDDVVPFIGSVLTTMCRSLGHGGQA